METIKISYWKLRKFDDLNYDNGTEFPYSEEKRNEIINDVLSKGYALMVIESGKFLRIYLNSVDNFDIDERRNSAIKKHPTNCSCHSHNHTHKHE